MKTFANMFDIQITAQKYMFSCSAKFLLHAFVEKLFKEEKFDSLRFAAISVLIHRSPLRCSFGFPFKQPARAADRSAAMRQRREIRFSEKKRAAARKSQKTGSASHARARRPLEAYSLQQNKKDARSSVDQALKAAAQPGKLCSTESAAATAKP